MGYSVNNTDLMTEAKRIIHFLLRRLVHVRNENLNRISQKFYSYNPTLNLKEIMKQFVCLPHSRAVFQRPKVFTLHTSIISTKTLIPSPSTWMPWLMTFIGDFAEVVCGWAHPLLRYRMNQLIDFHALESTESLGQSRVTLPVSFIRRSIESSHVPRSRLRNRLNRAVGSLYCKHRI